LLGFARWPIVLIAIAEATISVLFRQGRFTYLVTPKGGAALSVRSALRSVAPYLVLGLISAFVPIVYWKLHYSGAGYAGAGHAAGYVLFALMSSTAFMLILIAATADFVRVNLKYCRSKLQLFAKTLPFLAVTLLLFSGTFFSGWLNHTQTIAAITYRPAVSRGSLPLVAVQPAATAPASPSETAATVPAVSSWLFDPNRSGVTFGAYDPSGQL